MSASATTPSFPPFRLTALRRVLSIDPVAYATTRNRVDGRVTRLSPYITHGLVTPAEVFACWRKRFGLTLRDSLCQQLAWREFFHHVWRHRGDTILDDVHPGLPGVRYEHALPADIRMAATGIPVIDRSVRELYATGYLHNHQRLWLASYVVHVRRVHWRTGADWLYGHLLDGDLAANHLSWQWVAGTFSSKPYLFNNDNVLTFAPHLDSVGSMIDRSYPELDALARRETPPPTPALLGFPQREPALLVHPPDVATDVDLAVQARGRKVALLHPWSLGSRPRADLVVGVIHLPFHARFPWSARRWDFMLARMRALCDHLFVGDLAQSHRWLALADIVASEDTLNMEYAAALRNEHIQLDAAPCALPEPGAPCASFSGWLRVLSRQAPALFDQTLDTQVARLRHAP